MSAIHLHNYEAFLLDYSEGNLNEVEIAELKVFLHAHPELEIDLEDVSLLYLEDENHTADFKSSLKKTEDQVPDEELINYLEGNLSLEEKISFEIKLSQDADLAKELELYKKTVLLADNNEFITAKSDLQKTEDDLILNNRVIAFIENQLPLQEKLEFEKELKISASLQKEFEIYSKTILSIDASLVYPDKKALKKEAKIIAFFNLRTIGSVAAALLLLFGLALIYNYYGNKKSNTSGLALHPKTKNISKDHFDDTKGNIAKETDPIKKAKLNSPEIKLKDIPVPNKHKVQQNLEKTIENTEKELALEQKRPEEKISLPEKDNSVEVASIAAENIDSITNKKNYLLVAEDLSAEDELMELKESSNNEKRGLWKRAVQLAKQANKLGVKSIDGQENSKNNYRLSFNSFSVEKK